MYSNKLYTPLRYPGGKAKFAPYVARVMEVNELDGGHYLEPYAGGAGVALELLFHGTASHIHINDFDTAVFDFWSAVTAEPEAMLRLLADTPVNIARWHHWRAVLRGEIEVGQVERGFATLFMNRTNRSGVLKGGVIGGLAQDGAYKLDARFKKDVLAKRIEKIALHASRISVYNEDALGLLKRSSKFLPIKSLIYLDPPYYVKGQGLYRNFYEHEDHVRIAKFLQSATFRRSWMVSYDNVAEIAAMYRLANDVQYGLNYTAQKRYCGSEIMFFRPSLELPNDLLPGNPWQPEQLEGQHRVALVHIFGGLAGPGVLPSRPARRKAPISLDWRTLSKDLPADQVEGSKLNRRNRPAIDHML